MNKWDYTKDDVEELSFYVDEDEAIFWLRVTDLVKNAEQMMKAGMNTGEIVYDTIDLIMKEINNLAKGNKQWIQSVLPATQDD